jgi:BioD-like phosphotransacetylase family protein
VVASEGAVGKTTIGAGVGRYLLGDGRKVGFCKPIIGGNKKTINGDDSDAVFMKQIFNLSEPVDYLCPVIGGEGVLANRIKEAYTKAAQGKDVVIIEGISGQSPDDDLSRASHEIAEALDARVIIVEGYSNQSSGVKSTDRYKGFGKNLLGIVLNKVPESQLKRVSDELGKNVLGVLPEDRVLFTLSVGELAEYIQGEILNSAEKSAELVESLMVGAMCVDSGLEYFGRKANKAVVVRGDRPDMQLASLETLTRCLVISGGTTPAYGVLQKAENKGIPLILAQSDTPGIVTIIEDALGKTRFNQERKLPRLAEIMGQHLDFQAVYRGLGLAG